MGRRRKSAEPRTLIAIVQDRSGSMSNRRNATISGFNEYVGTLRDEAEGKVLVSLVQFNKHVTKVFTGRPLEEIQAMQNKDYVPGDMTALYDAVGSTIRDLELQARSDDRVTMVIMTDGAENISREYRHDTILSLLEQKRASGWEFIFLGAGEEAWTAGQSLGFNYNTSINYGLDDNSHMAAFQDLGHAHGLYTRGVSTSNYLSSSVVKANLETQAGFTHVDVTPPDNQIINTFDDGHTITNHIITNNTNDTNN